MFSKINKFKKIISRRGTDTDTDTDSDTDADTDK